MDVNAAALQLMEKKREVGYTAYNAFGHYRDRYYPIIQFFEEHFRFGGAIRIYQVIYICNAGHKRKQQV